MAGKALAVLKGNLRAVPGDEMVEALSDFALVDEVTAIDPGMMMAVPPPEGSSVRRDSVEAVAGMLTELAELVPVERMLRDRRGPKRTRPRRSSGKRVHHVSNKKLLDQAKKFRPRKH